MTETHPVLNQNEFKNVVIESGYSEHIAARLFNHIARDNWWEMRQGPRSSADICYTEITRDGELTTMMSIPNMAAKLEHISHIRGIGAELMQICGAVVDSAMRR